MKQILFFLLIAFSVTSCKVNYYQVYGVESNDLKQKDNSMVFENEDCKISYNLWGAYGSMAFIFENKTNQDIFIDLTQTFFIKNGAANDYYMNRSYERRTFAALNLGYSVSNTFIGLDGYWPTQYVVPSLLSAKATSNTKSGLSSSVTIKESEYVCVPAKSYKVLDYYDINPSLEITCDRKIDYPKNNITLHSIPEYFKC